MKNNIGQILKIDSIIRNGTRKNRGENLWAMVTLVRGVRERKQKARHQFLYRGEKTKKLFRERKLLVLVHPSSRQDDR